MSICPTTSRASSPVIWHEFSSCSPLTLYMCWSNTKLNMSSPNVSSPFFSVFWRLNIQFLRVRIQKRKDQPDTRFLYTRLTTNFPSSQRTWHQRRWVSSVSSAAQEKWIPAELNACSSLWMKKNAMNRVDTERFFRRGGNKPNNCWTYTMKSSMSMDLALLSQKLAFCRTPSIILLMLKSAGTSCQNGAQHFKKTSTHQRLERGGGRWEAHTSTHHIVYRAVNPVVLFQQLFHCSGPGDQKSTWHFPQQPRIKATCALSRQVLTWKLHWGFCFSSRRLFWQGHPIPYWDKRKCSL